MLKKKQNDKRKSLLAGASVFAAAAAALTATPAVAQDAEEDEAIVVTGSRIARQDYVANSPITTVDEEDMQITGATTVDTLINQLPQFAPGINQTSNNPSNGGQSNVQLRGLGANRTLVLLEGRRIVPSNSTTTVDLNIIPTQLIGNIEVVTGGASAAYGSDAVGGVVNFLLREFEGFEISAQYGITDQDDGETNTVSMALGGDFDGGRGRAMFMGSWNERQSIFNADRDFAAISGPSAASPLGNTIFDANNLPSQAAINAAITQPGLADCTPPGIDAACSVPTNTFGFNQNGTLFDYFQRRDFISPGGITFDGGLAPSPIQSANFQFITGALNYLQLPLERYNTFTHVEYDITPNLTAFGEFLWTQYESAQELAATPAAGGATGFRVPRSNPWIPTELGNVLDSRTNPAGTFLLDKRFLALGPRHVEEMYNVGQITFGLEGDINEEWSFNTFASYGRMDRDTIQTGNVSRGAVQRLLNDIYGGVGDEVFNPALDADTTNEADPDGNGAVCAGGFNPFGDNPLSAECQAFIGRTSKNVSIYEQQNVEATIQGPLFEAPAGEVQLALGAAYRNDEFRFVPDGSLSAAISAQPDGCGAPPAVLNNPCLTGNDIAGFNPANPLAGQADVFELFGEVLIPILRDLPLIQELNTTIGYRLSDYSTVGQVESYKGDVDWTVFDGFRFRGAYQRAVRAPSVGELFAIPTLGFPGIGQPVASGNPAFAGDPCDVRSAWRSTAGSNQLATSNANVEALCLALGVPAAVIETYQFTNQQVPAVQGGNPNLTEETATTWNVGAVWQPGFEGFLSSLSMSVDYWNIEIDQVIGTVPVTTARDQCFNRTGIENPTYDPNNFFCQLFVRNPLNGNITDYAANNLNLGSLRTSGVDLQVDWSHEVGPGDLSLSFLATWLENSSQQTLPGGLWTDFTGTISNVVAGSNPEWKWTTTANYGVGPFGFAVRWQHIDSMRNFNAQTLSVPEVDYYDALVNFDVNDAVRLSVGVNNVSDEQPPTYTSSVQANTDPSLYDVLGRRWFVGLRARF